MLRTEQVESDRLLAVAAHLLEVPAPDEYPLPAVARAVVEDKLALAGLDVFAPSGGSGDPFEDDDLML